MPDSDRVRFGILPKLMIFILIISLIPLLITALFSIFQMKVINNIAIDTSGQALENLGKTLIATKTMYLANGISVYLAMHQQQPMRVMLEDHNFKRLFQIKGEAVGVPEVYEAGTLKYLIHPNTQFINTSILDTREKFPEIVAILEGAQSQGFADGYYNFVDNNGKERKKYMYAMLVDKQLVAAVSTFLDEFSAPSQELGKQINKKSMASLTSFLLIILISGILVCVLAVILAGTITKPIKYLTDAANKISMGELDYLIEVKTQDEIGVLTVAVQRLQQSLQAAIERLKRKK